MASSKGARDEKEEGEDFAECSETVGAATPTGLDKLLSVFMVELKAQVSEIIETSTAEAVKRATAAMDGRVAALVRAYDEKASRRIAIVEVDISELATSQTRMAVQLEQHT